MSRIKFLETTLGNDIGEIVHVTNETESEVDYTDGLGRSCYFLKSEEGMGYLYIPTGKHKTREVACHARS